MSTLSIDDFIQECITKLTSLTPLEIKRFAKQTDDELTYTLDSDRSFVNQSELNDLIKAMYSFDIIPVEYRDYLPIIFKNVILQSYSTHCSNSHPLTKEIADDLMKRVDAILGYDKLDMCAIETEDKTPHSEFNNSKSMKNCRVRMMREICSCKTLTSTDKLIYSAILDEISISRTGAFICTLTLMGSMYQVPTYEVYRSLERLAKEDCIRIWSTHAVLEATIFSGNKVKEEKCKRNYSMYTITTGKRLKDKFIASDYTYLPQLISKGL